MNRRLVWSVMWYTTSLLAIVIICAAILVWWAVGGSLPIRSDLSIPQVENVRAIPAPEILSVASYNIGHGQGIKENAWDYRDKETTLQQLSQVADAMVRMNADIFLLQEVDLDSQRTFRINQIEFIKEKTKHPYHACALMWEKNYLPFPYWPPAHHLGYIRAANCILSRFPLSHHQRIIFEKPSSNPFWYNWGYIDRGVQRVDVEIAEQKFAVLNTHLEAWDKQTRESQIKVINDYINEIDIPIILGGDFNTPPPDAIKKYGFADDENINYEETTLTWFFAHAKNLQIPKLDAPNNTPFELFTFPSNHPDRRLDYIFLFGNTLSFIDFRVFYEAKTASDHLPVIAKIKYKD